jgi:hypothetical protein
MSLSNLSVALSMDIGGRTYEGLGKWKDYTFAFHVLVGVGALFTCGCWFLVPVIRKYCEPAAEKRS